LHPVVQCAFVLSCALTPVPVSSPSAQPHVFFMRSLSCRSLVYFLYLLCLCPTIAPLPTPCFSCACALLLPRRCFASSASCSTAPSITSCLPNPVIFRLDPVSFRPRSTDPFVSTSRLFVSYPVSFRFVPRFSFRHVPRVLSSSPQGSFVPNLV